MFKVHNTCTIKSTGNSLTDPLYESDFLFARAHNGFWQGKSLQCSYVWMQQVMSM